MSMTRSNLLVVTVMMFFYSPADASEDQFIFKELTYYPYVASKERAASITTDYRKKYQTLILS
jgi:hypothetical protein